MQLYIHMNSKYMYVRLMLIVASVFLRSYNCTELLYICSIFMADYVILSFYQIHTCSIYGQRVTVCPFNINIDQYDSSVMHRIYRCRITGCSFNVTVIQIYYSYVDNSLI
jgi:hypothetical protein